MTEEAVLTNISEMIDLAIGTPEVGVVDFCMLQTVLHCLAQQLRVQQKNVELRGSAAALPVGRPSDAAQTIAISEFIVDTEAPGGYELARTTPSPDQETMLVVERVKKVDAASSGRSITQDGSKSQSKTASSAKPGAHGGPGGGPGGGGGGSVTGGGAVPSGGPAQPTPPRTGGPAPPTAPPATPSAPSVAPPSARAGPGGGSGPITTTPSMAAQTMQTQSMTVPSASGPSPERLSLVTLSKFNLLESTVQDLKNRVYGSVPKNEEILQEVRSQGNLKAITDMWTNMNVQSRLDAAEEGISKLSSLIQDLIGETVELQKATGGAPSAATDRMAQAAKEVSETAKSPRGPPSTAAPGYGPPQGWQGGQGPPPPGAPGGPQGAPGTPGSQQGGPQGKGVASPGGVPMQGPGGVPMQGPGGVQMGPGGVQMGPGGVPMQGPGGVPMQGPGGVQMGPGGVQMGPGGVVAGPGGAPLAPGGGYAPGATVSQAAAYGMSPADLASLATKQELMNMMAHLQQLRNDLDFLTETFYKSMKEVNKNFVPPPPPPPPQMAPMVVDGGLVAGGGGGGYGGSGGGGGAGGGGPGGGGAGGIGGGGGGMTQGPGAGQMSMPQYQPQQMAPMPGMAPLNVLERLNDLEKQLKKCCDNITKSDGVVQDHLSSYQDQLEYLSKQVANVSMDLGTGKLSPDLVKDLQGLMQLFQTVQEMQSQLKQVHDTALHLAAEKEDRQSHIDALLEQIELLKTVKLDREDMVEALADKADLRMLARKVSHDQFETACDDLSKGLEHALGKLNVQEALWQQALDDIQREIETKLDKMELSPVKDFFNNKLKQLQENLKQMAALRREAEAAGTKRRLLRDVNCISCDAKAVMAMDAPSPLPPKPLPANLSMKPYLSYELDTIRKTQASSLPQRNMHDWEHIDKQMQPKQPYKVRSETDKHLCNRYCGGSHTVTTPAQRVARVGHFIKQWGPEVLPLSSGFAAGDDGRLYKVSAVEAANVGPGGAVEGAATCTPKSPVKKAETPKGPKPLIISAECRCLDPAATKTAERPSKV